jgi:hypothetical protein
MMARWLNQPPKAPPPPPRRIRSNPGPDEDDGQPPLV